MKKKLKPNLFWAVKYQDGFYSGTWLTRTSAWNDHARLTGLDNETYDQTWKRRRAAYGDRAVKVRLVEVKQK